MTDLLQHYQSGEHTKVWDELLAYGAQVREEPLLSEALAVARETMRRVRHNIDSASSPSLYPRNLECLADFVEGLN